MGIGSKAARFLMEQGLKRPFSGSVLTLGLQDLSFDLDRLSKTAQRAGFKSPGLANLARLPPHQPATDRLLFELLGFSEVVRTDVNAYQGAEMLFDLNDENGPQAEYRGHFDCVIDGGTMEHVFHVPNALKNIFEFTKVGGRIIHMSPTSNYVDHGFYSFSPTLFYDFYSENGFEIDQCRLFRHTYNVEGKAWIAGDYSPGSLDSISFGGLDDGLYATFFVATKTAASTAHRIPQQSLYRRHWAKKNPATPAPAGAPSEAFTQKVLRKARRLNTKLRRRLGLKKRFPIKPNIIY
jgi:hypothetical protein